MSWNLEFKPLKALEAEAWAILQAGYVSPAKYKVSKTETPELTTLQLEWVPLAQPYVRRWAYTAEDAARYQALCANGFSGGAYAGNRLLGLALAEPHRWNRVLWIGEFHVAEACRGQGVGLWLMARLTEKAQTAGLRALVCETQNTNVRAIRFYRRAGFTLEGVDLSYYSNDDVTQGEVALFMKKKLPGS